MGPEVLVASVIGAALAALAAAIWYLVTSRASKDTVKAVSDRLSALEGRVKEEVTRVENDGKTNFTRLDEGFARIRAEIKEDLQLFKNDIREMLTPAHRPHARKTTNGG